jgi:hypothetical protein
VERRALAEDGGCFLPRMRFASLTQVLESRSARARSLLLGFSTLYSTRSQSSNVRWVCWWREVICMVVFYEHGDSFH